MSESEKDDLNGIVDKAVEIAYAQWREDRYAEMIDVIKEKLDDHLDSILAKLLGMDKRWGGEWEVDHCNGRAGNSFIGEEIRSQVQPAVTQLVNDSIGEWEPTQQMKQQIAKEYRSELLMNAKRYARDIASRDVHALIEQSVERAVKEKLDEPQDP